MPLRALPCCRHLVEQDVGRFEVPVRDLVRVQRPDASRDVQRDGAAATVPAVLPLLVCRQRRPQITLSRTPTVSPDATAPLQAS